MTNDTPVTVVTGVNKIENLLKADEVLFKQIIKRLITVEVDKHISDNVNINNNIVNTLVLYFYGELSDVGIRNNNTYFKLNCLLCINYALSELISSYKIKDNGDGITIKLPYDLEDIQNFIEKNLFNDLSLIHQMQSLMRDFRTNNTISTDRWENFLGYDTLKLELFKEYHIDIDNVFNIVFKEIKRLFNDYPKVYALAISSNYINTNIKTKLKTYEDAFIYMFGKNLPKKEDWKAYVITYMFYYFGFNVMRLNKNKNVEFKLNGVINEDIYEFLHTLKNDKALSKKPIYNYINLLNTFIFIDKGDGKPWFSEVFLKNILGEKLNIYDYIKNSKNNNLVLKNLEEKHYNLATLQEALLIQKGINDGSITELGKFNKTTALVEVRKFIDMCEIQLEEYTFFTKFGEYLLIDEQ